MQYSAGLVSNHPNWVRDGWFDGYTPNLVGSIHIGYDVSTPEHHMTMSPVDPSANAAQIFHDIIALALANEAPEQFPVGPYPYITGTAQGVDYVNQMNGGQNHTNPTNAITNLSATYNPNANTVTLSWSGNFSQPVTYVVTRVSTNGADETVPVGQTTAQTITDTSVQPNETYIYTVQATSQATGQAVGKPASVTVTTSQAPPNGGNQTNTAPPGNGLNNTLLGNGTGGLGNQSLGNTTIGNTTTGTSNDIGNTANTAPTNTAVTSAPPEAANPRPKSQVVSSGKGGNGGGGGETNGLANNGAEANTRNTP